MDQRQDRHHTAHGSGHFSLDRQRPLSGIPQGFRRQTHSQPDPKTPQQRRQQFLPAKQLGHLSPPVRQLAQRLCAKPGSPDYGAISVFVAYYGSPKKILNVPAGCFVPAPKVDSAVVRIDIHDKPPVEGDPALLFRVVRAAFGQRRKTLYNALSTGFSELGKERIAAVLAEAGVEPTVRGEKLSLEEFAAISRVIEKSINNL